MYHRGRRTTPPDGVVGSPPTRARATRVGVTPGEPDRLGSATVREAPIETRVIASKSHIRVDLRRRLAEVPREEAAAAAVRVADRVLGLPEVAAADGVFSCLSFGHEIDTWGLIDRLRDRGHRVYVPRAAHGSGALHVHPWPCALRELSFGLRQPPEGAPELTSAEVDRSVDVALIVGLAFDREGYRLGYGGGYFDRFLDDHDIPAIGLAFDFQLLEALPRDTHDIPMDVVVTPSEVLRPNG